MRTCLQFWVDWLKAHFTCNIWRLDNKDTVAKSTIQTYGPLTILSRKVLEDQDDSFGWICPRQWIALAIKEAAT